MSEFNLLEIEPNLKTAISEWTSPETLGFGKATTPIMVSARYDNGSWEAPEILPYGNLHLDPSAKVLHYGTEIFEGMKAYNNSGKIQLFRPDANGRRLNASAMRMEMPEIPLQHFMDSVASISHHLASVIPAGDGESLYLRPFMIGTGCGLGLDISTQYQFLVIASPSGSFFKADRVNVLIEREGCRAAAGGTGAAKAGGNYGGSLKALKEAHNLGYQQNIWLDAQQHRYFEELSGMNFFVVKNGELYTPSLTDTILPGITRDSLIQLARHHGYKVHEVKLEVDEVVKGLQDGSVTEMFSCGTAAVLTPIAALGERDGTLYQAEHTYGPVSEKLRKALVELQRGQGEDPFNWMLTVN